MIGIGTAGETSGHHHQFAHVAFANQQGAGVLDLAHGSEVDAKTYAAVNCDHQPVELVQFNEGGLRSLGCRCVCHRFLLGPGL